MKKCLVFAVFLTVFLLSACVDTTVSYRLAADSSINVDYRMEITPDGEDISAYTDEIIYYWETMGFTAESAETASITTLTGTKTVACKDMNAAVDEIMVLFTGEDSLFYDVDFKYTPSYFQDDFSLVASVSLENLLRQNSSGSLPAAEAQELLNQAGEAQYTLSISLPGEVVSTNAAAQDGQVCTWNLAYGEVTKIELVTTNVFSENVANYQAQQQTRTQDTLLAAVLGGIALLALAAAVIVFVRVRKKRALPTETAAAPLYMPTPPSDDGPPTDQRF